MATLLILIEAPFKERDYERFGVEILKKDFDVRVIDCTPWLNPHIWDKFSNGVYSCPEHELLESRNDLGELLLRCRAPIVIDYLGACAKSEWIRSRLEIKKILTVKIQGGLLPNLNRNKNLIRIIFDFLKQKNALKKIAIRLLNRIIKIKKHSPSVIILGGTDGLNQAAAKNAKYQISAHSFDYDIYLKLRNNLDFLEEQYAVFLDEDFVHHWDFEFAGVSPPVSEEEYYSKLNNFFNIFEKSTGLKIIFAAHPSSTYGKRLHLLQGRPFVVGKTAALVKDSKIVLMHASTSQSFAVLWRKPLIFLTSNEIISSPFGEHIDFRARFFNKIPVNMSIVKSSDLNLEKLLILDGEKYDSYKNLYLKIPESLDLPIWEIFRIFLAQKENHKNY